jgi:GTP cyclohydrolase FolE2
LCGKASQVLWLSSSVRLADDDVAISSLAVIAFVLESLHPHDAVAFAE